MEGRSGGGGLEPRSTKEYFVVRGNEELVVLIARRTDNISTLECLKYEVHDGHHYKKKGKNNMARSRLLICEVVFKQNIGHLGEEIVVCGVHGHNRTMKLEWPQVWVEFWDRLAQHVKSYGIQFLAGDFNMSITEVPKHLRSRRIQCDCVAWYPWQHTVGSSPAVAGILPAGLGFGPCGIFYIGGCVDVHPLWGLQHVGRLAAVAGDDRDLDVYGVKSAPGQPWRCYTSKGNKETDADKNLGNRLHNPSAPTTSPAELSRLPKRVGQHYCPYLRLKQKTYGEGGVARGWKSAQWCPLSVMRVYEQCSCEERAGCRKASLET